MTPELTKNDTYIIFRCNHAALNPHPHYSGTGNFQGYVCPICQRMKRIRESWVRCQGENCETILHRPNNHSRREFCDNCIQQRRDEKNARYSHINLPDNINFAEPVASFTEIANEENISKQAAQQILARAVRKFKKNWQWLYGEEPIFDDPDLSPWNLGEGRMKGRSV